MNSPNDIIGTFVKKWSFYDIYPNDNCGNDNATQIVSLMVCDIQEKTSFADFLQYYHSYKDGAISEDNFAQFLQNNHLYYEEYKQCQKMKKRDSRDIDYESNLRCQYAQYESDKMKIIAEIKKLESSSSDMVLANKTYYLELLKCRKKQLEDEYEEIY